MEQSYTRYIFTILLLIAAFFAYQHRAEIRDYVQKYRIQFFGMGSSNNNVQSAMPIVKKSIDPILLNAEAEDIDDIVRAEEQFHLGEEK